MKFWDAPSTVLKNSWDQVVTAYWQRYPNPYSTHVLTEDTIKRKIVDGKLCTTRFLTKTGGGLPRWAERFVPHKLVTIVEESVVDPQKQTLTTYTRNIGYHNRIVSITEKVVYKQDPVNSHQTLVSRYAWIESQFHISQLRRPIESFIVDRFRKNCVKATNGFQWVLSKMWSKEQGASNSGQAMLNDIAMEAARRATTQIASHAKVGLSS